MPTIACAYTALFKLKPENKHIAAIGFACFVIPELLTFIRKTYVLKYERRFPKLAHLATYAISLLNIGLYYHSSEQFKIMKNLYSETSPIGIVNGCCYLVINSMHNYLICGLKLSVIGFVLSGTVVLTVVLMVKNYVKASMHRLTNMSISIVNRSDSSANILSNGINSLEAAIQYIRTEIDNNRSFEVKWGDTIIISSNAGPTKVVSDEDLSKYCELRCPGLNNKAIVTDETCAICAEMHTDKQLSRTLPCKHSFHAECIDKWLLCRSAVCPICRFNLTAHILETKDKIQKLTQNITE